MARLDPERLDQATACRLGCHQNGPGRGKRLALAADEISRAVGLEPRLVAQRVMDEGDEAETIGVPPAISGMAPKARPSARTSAPIIDRRIGGVGCPERRIARLREALVEAQATDRPAPGSGARRARRLS